MSHAFANLLAHIVFSTKDRVPLIGDSVRHRLWPYLGGIAREFGAKALAVGGTADHVHLLVSAPPTGCVSDFLRVLKANSSRWVHETWPGQSKFAWQRGYAAFSVSESNRQAVAEYIANQEQHHRRISFQEEFLALLKKHNIQYDERYIWV